MDAMPGRLNPVVKLAAIVAAVVVAAGIGLRLDWFVPTPQPTSEVYRFEDGFEGAATLEDLFPADGSRWHLLQVASAEDAPPSSVELTSEQVRSGTQALKMTAGPYDGRTVPKADIGLADLRFVKGDDVWFRGWFLLVDVGDASDIYLWDLETTRKRGSPGRRVFIGSDGSLASDLGKWHSGPTFRQPAADLNPFPVGRWVELTVSVHLSDGADGRMRVWQDGELVLTGEGQTLPTAQTVYDRMQVGITANANAHQAQTLFVDDVVVSNGPLPSP